MWVWRGCRAWLGGQHWCIMCKGFNVNRGWLGKGNVPIQISITLSSSPCCLVAMTSWWTGTKTGGNYWFLMLEQCLPGACGSHISKQAIGLLVDYVHRSVCWIYNTFWFYLFKFFVVLVYLTGTELIDQVRKNCKWASFCSWPDVKIHHWEGIKWHIL